MAYATVLLEDNGEQTVTYPKEIWAWGDKKNFKVVFISRKQLDLTGATAQFTIYLAGAAQITASVTPTISAKPGKYRATCEYLLDTSTTPFVAGGGEYVGVMSIAVQGYKRAVRIPVEVQSIT